MHYFNIKFIYIYDCILETSVLYYHNGDANGGFVHTIVKQKKEREEERVIGWLLRYEKVGEHGEDQSEKGESVHQGFKEMR